MLLAALGADELLLSGRGLREGIALQRLGLPVRSALEERHASVAALARRFSTWDGPRAQLRSEVAERLMDALDPGAGAATLEALAQAALLVDIGRSVDYYSRWEHAARIVADSDLYGFSHREIVLLSAVLERAGEDRVTLPGYRSLVNAQDRAQLERLAVILVLADELSHRMVAGEGVQAQLRRGGVTLLMPGDVGPLDDETTRRFQRVFGRRLRLSVGR